MLDHENLKDLLARRRSESRQGLSDLLGRQGPATTEARFGQVINFNPARKEK